MVIITNKIWCPLCEAEMKKDFMMYGQMKANAYICYPCQIFTFSFDPAFNKWRDADKTIPCPNCEHKEVKWFSRHVDQYIKFKCPKCGVVGEGDCNAFVKDDGTMDLELMDGSEQQGEENRVEIPIDSLRIPLDMKQKLKHKMKRNRLRGEGQ